MCVERVGCACLWRDSRYVAGKTFVYVSVEGETDVCASRGRFELWRETRVWVFVGKWVCVCVCVCVKTGLWV